MQFDHAINESRLELNTIILRGLVAQWLEQRTHNPLVPGSSPGEPMPKK